MDEGAFIPDQQVVHLDTPTSRSKMRRQDVESNVSTRNQSDSFLGIVWKSSIQGVI